MSQLVTVTLVVLSGLTFFPTTTTAQTGIGECDPDSDPNSIWCRRARAAGASEEPSRPSLPAPSAGDAHLNAALGALETALLNALAPPARGAPAMTSREYAVAQRRRAEAARAEYRRKSAAIQKPFDNIRERLKRQFPSETGFRRDAGHQLQQKRAELQELRRRRQELRQGTSAVAPARSPMPRLRTRRQELQQVTGSMINWEPELRAAVVRAERAASEAGEIAAGNENWQHRSSACYSAQLRAVQASYRWRQSYSHLIPIGEKDTTVYRQLTARLGAAVDRAGDACSSISIPRLRW